MKAVLHGAQHCEDPEVCHGVGVGDHHDGGGCARRHGRRRPAGDSALRKEAFSTVSLGCLKIEEESTEP